MKTAIVAINFKCNKCDKCNNVALSVKRTSAHEHVANRLLFILGRAKSLLGFRLAAGKTNGMAGREE